MPRAEMDADAGAQGENSAVWQLDNAANTVCPLMCPVQGGFFLLERPRGVGTAFFILERLDLASYSICVGLAKLRTDLCALFVRQLGARATHRVLWHALPMHCNGVGGL